MALPIHSNYNQAAAAPFKIYSNLLTLLNLLAYGVATTSSTKKRRKISCLVSGLRHLGGETGIV
jgi:hypothetical protein